MRLFCLLTLILATRGWAMLPVLGNAGLKNSQSNSISLFSDSYFIYQNTDLRAAAEHSGIVLHTSREDGFSFSAQLNSLEGQIETTDSQLSVAKSEAQALLVAPINKRWRLSLGTHQAGIGYQLGKYYAELNGQCENQSVRVLLGVENQNRSVEVGSKCKKMLKVGLGYDDAMLAFSAHNGSNWQLKLSALNANLSLWQSSFFVASDTLQFNDLSLSWQAQTLQIQGVAISGKVKRFVYFANYANIDYAGEFDLRADDEILQNIAGGRYMLVNRLQATSYELGASYMQPVKLVRQDFELGIGLSYAALSGQGSASLYRNLLFIPLPVLRYRETLPEHSDALNLSLLASWQSPIGKFSAKASQLIPIEEVSAGSAGSGAQSGAGRPGKKVSGGTVLSLSLSRKLD